MRSSMMDLAERVARSSDHFKAQVGAVIVSGSRILNVAHNTMKTHPKSRSMGNHLHAEVRCLIGLHHSTTRGADMYVCRVTRAGKRSVSKPCWSCTQALLAAGIKRVFYIDQQGEICVLPLKGE